jgi:hypothetical protein
MRIVNSAEIYKDLMEMTPRQLSERYSAIRPSETSDNAQLVVRARISEIIQLMRSNGQLRKFLGPAPYHGDGTYFFESERGFQVIHFDHGVGLSQAIFENLEDALFYWLDQHLTNFGIGTEDSVLNSSDPSSTYPGIPLQTLELIPVLDVLIAYLEKIKEKRFLEAFHMARGMLSGANNMWVNLIYSCYGGPESFSLLMLPPDLDLIRSKIFKIASRMMQKEGGYLSYYAEAQDFGADLDRLGFKLYRKKIDHAVVTGSSGTEVANNVRREINFIIENEKSLSPEMQERAKGILGLIDGAIKNPYFQRF